MFSFKLDEQKNVFHLECYVENYVHNSINA